MTNTSPKAIGSKTIRLATAIALASSICVPEISFAETEQNASSQSAQNENASEENAQQPSISEGNQVTDNPQDKSPENDPAINSDAEESEAAVAPEQSESEPDESLSDIPDGAYVIQSAIDHSFVLDNANAATSNGTKLQLWQANSTDAQIWIVSHDAQGFITFKNASSGLAIDVSGANPASGTKAQLWQQNGTFAQKWTVKNHEDGSVEIVSALDKSVVLDAWCGIASNGTQIDIYQNNQTKAQRWNFIPAQTLRDRLDAEAGQHSSDIPDGDYYIFSNIDNSKALDLSGASLENSAKIQLYAANGTNAQIWTITHDRQGYVTIQNKASGKAADVAGGNSAQGTRVAQYEGNGTYAQKWIACKQNDGSVVFKSALSESIVLDVANGSNANGTPMQIWQENGTKAQSWTLEGTEQAYQDALELAKTNRSAIEDGQYVLFSSLGNAQAIDVSGGSTSDGAALQIYASNMTNAQKWAVEHDDQGFVRIKNVGSGKYVTANTSFAQNGIQLTQQAFSTNSKGQQFIATHAQDSNDAVGFCLLSALNPTKAIDVAGGSSQSGTRLQLYSANGTAAQNFIARPVSPNVDPCADILPTGWLRISPAANRDMAIDIANASRANGANAQAWQKNGSLAQLFSFEYREGYYVIRNAASGKLLDVASGNLAPGTNIQQWSDASTDDQLFSARQNEDGSYAFTSKANGLTVVLAQTDMANGTNLQTDIATTSNQSSFFFDSQADLLAEGIYTISPTAGSNRALDVSDGSKSEGANIQAYEKNGTYAQKWKLAKVAGSSNVYTIESLLSGMVLTCEPDGNVCQEKASSVESQYWQPSIEANGSIAFRNMQTNEMLSIESEGANGANVFCGMPLNGSTSSFYLTSTNPVNNGMKTVALAQNTSMVLDVAGCSYARGANIQLYQTNNSGAQKWNITSNGDGTYSIQSAETTQALDIPSGNAYAGANVQQWDRNNSAAQHWVVTYERNGGFSLRSSLDQTLALTATSTASGANINLQPFTGADSQLFTFIDTAYPNDTVMGIQRSKIVSHLESHQYDGYYLGTPYSTGFTIDTCTYPNGSRRWDGFSGMNCAGFLATVFGSQGLNLWNIAANNNHSPWTYGPGGGSYVNAWRWYGYAIDSGYKVYEFNSIADLVNSGMAKKGDIIFLKTKPGTDCHIGIFWGDISRDNKMWHSGEPNQISAIYNADCRNEQGQTAVLIK